MQLLTIEGLLSGKQRADHPDDRPDVTFKKARREKRPGQPELFEEG